MASVRPFRALRPTPDAASDVASVPYDVVSVSEAQALAKGNALSFLHVVRPEIDLPAGTDEHADAVYEGGARALAALAESDSFQTDAEPRLYVYRLTMNGRDQTGVVGLVSAAAYGQPGGILRHENTRPDKEDDRTRHIRTQRAHAEPVMLTYRAADAVDALVAEAMDAEPLYDFQAKDYVQHTVWPVPDATALSEAFGAIESLYVADGHHRCAAAARVAREMPDEPEAQHFLAVLFPMEDMEIQAYNRVVTKLPAGKKRFLEQLRSRFDIEESVFAEPDEPGLVGVYLDEETGWFSLALPATARDGVANTLDVARLAEFVLEPMLGIQDPRTDANISFVGGIRGTEELERLVDSGEADIAFAMFPTAPEDLLDVSDAGELMPPKSTWFEPKLRSGLLVHQF